MPQSQASSVHIRNFFHPVSLSQEKETRRIIHAHGTHDDSERK